MQKKISDLTGLRGLAAFWVFAYHAIPLTAQLDPSWTWPLRSVATAGYLGVDLFFALSGFVISYNYAGAGLHRSATLYGQFIWKRIARIYPAHLAALLFFAAGLSMYPANFDLSLMGLVKSLTMTQAWAFPAHQVWNPVAWSVSCEWAAYLLFPLIALAARRLPPWAAAVGIVCAYAALYVAYRGPWESAPYSFGLQRVAASFTAGVLVYEIWRRRDAPLNIIGWFAIVAMIVGASLLDLKMNWAASAAKLPILGSIVVYALACATGSLARAFKRFEYAGCISYSFYLVHWVPLALAQSLLSSSGGDRDPLSVYAALGFSLLTAVAMADFFYRYIEEPARRWLMQAMTTREAAHAVRL